MKSILWGPKLVGAFYFWTIQIRWLEYIFWNQNQLLVVCDDLPVSSNVIWWMEIFDLKLISKLKVKSESVVTYKKHSQSVAKAICFSNQLDWIIDVWSLIQKHVNLRFEPSPLLLTHFQQKIISKPFSYQSTCFDRK